MTNDALREQTEAQLHKAIEDLTYLHRDDADLEREQILAPYWNALFKLEQTRTDVQLTIPAELYTSDIIWPKHRTKTAFEILSEENKSDRKG